MNNFLFDSEISHQSNSSNLNYKSNSNLENNIDLGRSPIELRETIRFEEYLEGNINLGPNN